MADRTWQKASTGTALLSTPTPLLLSFPTRAGSTVEVSAVDGSSAPYRWVCSAGHDEGHAYASLPFCRDDAKAHAAGCRGVEVDRLDTEFGADEHGKTKEPLPPRPRGPHPYRTAVA